MKKIKNLSERNFLKLFFFFFSCSFLTAAFFMPDAAYMFTGLWKIISRPTLGSTNFFSVGGYAATFLNMGLVGLVCTALYCIPGEKKANNVATLATILTIGFGSWGIHIVNMLPTMLGVCVYCWVNGHKIGDETNAMLFTTGLAPFISELLVRYPNIHVVGFSLERIGLTLVVGIAAGFVFLAGLDHSPRVHRGGVLYSAALPVGMTAFLLQGFLYKAMGVVVPAPLSDLSVSSAPIVNTFCIILFGSMIGIALMMGCRPKDYWRLLTNPQKVMNFSNHYGTSVMLMNVGVYGLFILAYYNDIGAQFNGVTFGVIFCMLSTCNSGSHPGNVITITAAYALISKFFQLLSPTMGGGFTQYLHAQAIIIGVCFANGLSPISDKYGWFWGMLAAFFHFCMVTTTPSLHGGMCLYNGGFTGALVCLLMLPVLEKNVPTKLQRMEAKVLMFKEEEQ